MKIPEFYKKQKHTFSFEFFPPKTDEAEAKLFETARELQPLKPSFISVTYGAMGTTRSNTLRIVGKIKKEIGIEAAAHLTCVGQTRDEIETVLGELQKNGVENIVALRGDPPKGETEFKPVPNGFRYASELVSYIRKHPKFSQAFSLAVAGYPETHMECRDKIKDLAHLQSVTFESMKQFTGEGNPYPLYNRYIVYKRMKTLVLPSEITLFPFIDRKSVV